MPLVLSETAEDNAHHQPCAFLTRNAGRLADRPALIDEGQVISWVRLDERVSALAMAMCERFDVKVGDRVLVQSANNVQIPEVMLASWGCLGSVELSSACHLNS